MMPKDVVIIGEDVLQRTAKIIGGNSAAELALKDAERRRTEGQNPVFYYSRSAQAFFVSVAGR